MLAQSIIANALGGCIAVDLVRPYCALLPETFAPMIEIRCIGDGATSLHRTEG